MSGQFVKPQAGEKCDSYCGNGARCVRGLCECPEGYNADSGGYCQQQTDQAATQSGNEVMETQAGGIANQNVGQGQDDYMVGQYVCIIPS